MGSGGSGIRYNNSLKRIQLLSEDGSTWVNWKVFDAYATFKNCFINSSNSSSYSYTFENPGLYIIGGAVRNGVVNMTTNATYANINTYSYTYSGSDTRRSYIWYIIAQVGQTVSGSYISDYPAGVGMFYIGSGYSSVEVVQKNASTDGKNEYSFTNQVNRVLVGFACGNSRVTTASSSTNQYWSDSGTRAACASTANESGSCSIIIQGQNYGVMTIADLKLIQ